MRTVSRIAAATLFLVWAGACSQKAVTLSVDVVQDGGETATGEFVRQPEVVPETTLEIRVPCGSHADCEALTAQAGTCRMAMCDQAAGFCFVGTMKDGMQCDDANPCTQDTICLAGQCGSGQPLVCDDANPCTLDGCNPDSGCSFLPLDGAAEPCDDGNPCTQADHCVQGACSGDSAGCTCTTTEDCAALDDDDACNGYLECKEGTCVTAPGSAVVCPPVSGPCLKSECDIQTGTCLALPLADGTACQDGDPCTIEDSCAQGICAPGAENVCAECKEDGDCLELAPADMCLGNPICKDGHCALDPAQKVVCNGQPCVAAACDPETGKCIEQALADGTWCTDEDACTGQDKCKAGKCGGKTLPCDDGNACTKDVCLAATGCQFTNLSDIPCDTDSPCAQESWCKNGKCLTTAQVDCQDDNPCTEDFCDPEKGCEHKPLTAVACDDSNPCTQDDLCLDGTCQPGMNTCDCKTDLDCADYEDGNLCNGTLVCNEFACTVDPGSVVTCNTEGDTDCKFTTCNPLTGTCGKIEAPYGSACNDADSCTVGETCFYGECLGGITLPCDDASPCTADTCSPTAGCQHDPLDEGACDDLDGCTADDTCQAGICVGGTNICGCGTQSDCAQFEDGDLCNGTLTCKDGKCVVKEGTVVSCPVPSSPCQTVYCSKQTGECKTDNLPPATLCSDNDACTGKDACYDGTCKGEALICSDTDPCTNDSCDPAAGCVHEPASDVPCDDGNPCTTGDSCADGKCISGTNECVCQTDADCSNDENDKCSGTMICLQGKCVLDPKTVVKCDASLDTPCSKNLCNPTTGKCALTQIPDGTVCDDKLFCTKDDVCQQGKCLGGKLDCADGNPCTDDVCVEAQQGCVYLNNTLPCNDDSQCTKNDSCKSGKCLGDPVSCDDGNVCTKDSCNAATGCAHAPADGSCDDGDKCTTGDSCSQGKCTGQPLPCDDANPCTTDVCDPAIGCKFTNNSLPCEDGNPCTVKDICQDGKCLSGAPKDCDDDNACTADSCDPATGCVQTPQSGTPCDDGNPCTLADSCKNGVCSSGSIDSCDDKNPCTQDGCNTNSGCTHTPQPGKACNDGDACTTGDICVNDKCAGSPLTCTDNNVCTDDLCDPTKGCVYPPVSDLQPKSCDDGNKCTAGDICVAGKCQSGPPKVCLDNNPCTDDSCNPASGECVFANNTAPCNDGSVCTQTDKCTAGKCVGSSPLTCNDNNTCTTDTCDPLKGCQFTWNGTCQCSDDSACKDDGDKCNGIPKCIGGFCSVPSGSAITCDPAGDTPCKKNKCVPATGLCVLTPEPSGTPCSDGSACTSDDKCSATGSCVGASVICEDNNQCTDNKCNAATGCYYPLKSGPCDDGNPCTVDDSCITGSCQGKPFDCNDSNPCTQDICVPSNGLPTCSHPPQAGTCNDNNQCTIGDACANGTCTGSPLTCSDGNACTNDSCDPKTGCVYSPSPDGTACSDGNLCTQPDTCSSGTCKAGPWALACCLGPKDCEDNYPCTTETCSANKCTYTLNSCGQSNACLTGFCTDAGTCDSDPAQSTVTILSQSFETGGAPGWLFGINTGGSPDIYWSVTDKRSYEGKMSLYVGNPSDFTYDHGTGNTVALSPPVALPAGKEASVKFQVHSLVQEAGCSYDFLLIQVHDATGAVTTIGQQCDPTASFEQRTYSLKDWAGQTVRIGFLFQTVDPAYNNAEGIYIDAFSVTTEPVAGCCSLDSHCEDSELCTADVCTNYQCTYPSVPGTFFQEDFDSGSIEWSDSVIKTSLWYITSTNPDIYWSVDNFKSFSTPFSLYAGNVKSHSYNYGATMTRIRTPLIKLPSDSAPVVRFRMWLSVAETNCNDLFRVGTTTGTGGETIAWHATYCTPTSGGFQDITVELPSSIAAAKQVFVHLQFVADAANNNAQGVFIDNFRLEQKGASSCCEDSSECNDKSDCTVDACEGTGKGGICFNHKVLNWVESFDDGAAQGWTFESSNPAVSWSTTTYRAYSTKYSLYCGRPLDHAYMDMLGGTVRTTTPEFYVDNASGTLTPQLAYQRYLHLHNHASHCFSVEVMEKGGIGYIQTVECGDKLAGVEPKWVAKSLGLGSFKGKTISVRFTLSFTGSTLPITPTPEGAYIDDVKVGYFLCN